MNNAKIHHKLSGMSSHKQNQSTEHYLFIKIVNWREMGYLFCTMSSTGVIGSLITLSPWSRSEGQAHQGNERGRCLQLWQHVEPHKAGSWGPWHIPGRFYIMRRQPGSWEAVWHSGWGVPWGVPWGLSSEESACNAGDTRDAGSVSGLGNAIHCSVLAWRIPCTEEPGVLQVHGVTESAMAERLSTHPPHTHAHKNKLYSGRFREELVQRKE